MRTNNWGRFITITSSALKATCIRPPALQFCVRAALDALARTYGITVKNVCPGYTRTARPDHLAKSISARSNVKPEEVFTGWAREIPAGGIGTPEEFAAVVAFLASLRVTDVNGTSIAVDGVLVRSLL